MALSDHKFFDLFAIDLQRVVSDEIDKAFGPLVAVELNNINLSKLRQYEEKNPHATKGLYILKHKGKPCYIGKAENSLAKRLQEHFTKLGARLNISVRDISFCCLYLDKNWSALAHEASLIERMKSSWNNNGFGNNDPGRKRDSTVLKNSHFDRLHPINPNIGLSLPPGKYSVTEALVAIKKELPYLLRYEAENSQLLKGVVTLTKNETASTALGKIADALGASWQVTFLFGYVIFYEEAKNYGLGSCQSWKRGNQDWKTP